MKGTPEFDFDEVEKARELVDSFNRWQFLRDCQLGIVLRTDVYDDEGNNRTPVAPEEYGMFDVTLYDGVESTLLGTFTIDDILWHISWEMVGSRPGDADYLPEYHPATLAFADVFEAAAKRIREMVDKNSTEGRR